MAEPARSIDVARVLREAVVVWHEDDATAGQADHEQVSAALKRIWPYGQFDQANCLAFQDNGDSTTSVYLYGGDTYVIVDQSYPGNSRIRVAHVAERAIHSLPRVTEPRDAFSPPIRTIINE